MHYHNNEDSDQTNNRHYKTAAVISQLFRLNADERFDKLKAYLENTIASQYSSLEEWNKVKEEYAMINRRVMPADFIELLTPDQIIELQLIFNKIFGLKPSDATIFN